MRRMHVPCALALGFLALLIVGERQRWGISCNLRLRLFVVNDRFGRHRIPHAHGGQEAALARRRRSNIV